jgi:Tol biopolymer transport system component
LQPYRITNIAVYLLFIVLILTAILFIPGCTFQNRTRDGNPDWSPDGSRIAFSSDRTGKNEIYLMKADGSDQTRLTYNPDKTNPNQSWEPKWSPDGTKIAFTFGYTPVPSDTRSSIDIMNADGTNQLRITFQAKAGFQDQADLEPDWSPDGTRIVFTSNRVVNRQIYVMNADGSDQTRLTYDGGYNNQPVWSPDGTQIAYVSNRNIYVMNSDGTNPIKLTSNSNDGNPAWSPDGKQIVFNSIRDGRNYEIYVMNADGSNQTRLSNSPGFNGEPSWSPDAKKIAFSSDRDGNYKIYIINIVDENQAQLSGSLPQLKWGNLLFIIFLAVVVVVPILVLRRRRLLGRGKASEFAIVSLVLGIIGTLGFHC